MLERQEDSESRRSAHVRFRAASDRSRLQTCRAGWKSEYPRV